MEFHISRVVYRGYNNANSNGGVSNANANNDASNSNTNVGSRLDNCNIGVQHQERVPKVVPNGTSLTNSSPCDIYNQARRYNALAPFLPHAGKVKHQVLGEVW